MDIIGWQLEIVWNCSKLYTVFSDIRKGFTTDK